MQRNERSPRRRTSGLKSVLTLATLCLGFATTETTHAAELQVLLPLGRPVYQTNEVIDVSVVRSDSAGLKAGDLTLTLTGDAGAGGKLTFTFPVEAVAAQGDAARTTEHFHVSGWLLRPGKYTVEVASDGATAKGEISVFNHVRRSSFKLINWGRSEKQEQQLPQGEDSLGFNTYYGGYGNDDQAHFIAAGVDFISCCTMSGAHQMDLRMECDWSDPAVTRGGTARVVRRAFQDRTRPNVPGVHFYDEPGLTWTKDPATGVATPHWVPAQRQAFEAAFGKEAPDYKKIDPSNPGSVRAWTRWAYWKLAFMDSAWKEAQFGVSYVRPDYLSLTQSQYGATAFTDGYYFNVVRSLPVTSGHGGYDDFGFAYFNPSFTLELARARDLSKPCWYLPTWYGNTPSDRFRLEQYLSFITNIQGMISPPDLDPVNNATGRQGIVESNQLMSKLGTIFTTMPVTRPPVAMLYSLSDAVYHQVQSKGELSYAHAVPQGEKLGYTYLAGKLIQQPFLFVVDEDVIDGTLAANHKAVILTAIHHLDPKVVRALEKFAAGGGLVYLTGDCKVQVMGAIKLDAQAKHPDEAVIKSLVAEKKFQEANAYNTAGKLMQGAKPLAEALKAQFDKANIKPVFTTDNPQIVAGRQAQGDIEYLFAVNATYDEQVGEMNSIKAAEAKITLDADARPVYDAINGGPVAFEGGPAGRSGTFRFGPGQMRAFARTARPIGKVMALPVSVAQDLVADEQPIRITVGAALLDDKGGVLAGSAPLHVRVIDPLGTVRHEVYRATTDGMLSETLPLAANDPAGEWKVVVHELLNDTEDTRTFAYNPAAACGAAAGGHRRAAFYGNDDDNAFRFARVHHDVTIVKGASDYNTAAAERLTKVLTPWGVRTKIVNAADVSGPRKVSPEQAPTWIGIDVGRVTDGGDKQVSIVGFAVDGPVILLGTPEDNPLIKFAAERKFLAYTPQKDAFPGRGRGMFAWQRDMVGKGQESVALIAYDADGMAEAVGSFYEAVHGLDPVTRWTLPADNTIEPAKAAPAAVAEAKRLWEVSVPDRVLSIRAEGGNLSVVSADGTMTTISADGKIAGAKALPPAELQQAAAALPAAIPDLAKVQLPGRLPKLTAALGDKMAVAYWGGTLQVADAAGKTTIRQQMPQDVTALAVMDGKLVVGLATGQVLALDTN